MTRARNSQLSWRCARRWQTPFFTAIAKIPQKKVHVRCECDAASGISLVVRDEGPGFDPGRVPDPLAPENLDAEHGRGILLMKQFMDEIHYERGGTEVHMHKGPPAS